jgi:hypothetical protein
VFFAAGFAVYGLARIVPDLAAWALGLVALGLWAAVPGALAAAGVLWALRRADLGRHALVTQRTVAVVTRQNLAIAAKRARAVGAPPVRVAAELVPLPTAPVRQPLGLPARRPVGVVLPAGERGKPSS